MIKGYRKIYRKTSQVPEEFEEPKVEKEVIQKTVEITPRLTPKVKEIAVPVKIVPVLTEEGVGKEKEKEEFEVKEKGVEIPDVILPNTVKPGKIETERFAKIRLSYPLIPKRPKKGEPIFAYAKIYWDEKAKRYFYEVVEPELSEKIKDIMKKVKDLLEQRLDVDFSKIKKVEALEYLRKQIKDIVDYFGFKLNETEKQILNYYIERDFVGLGKLEPLMKDDQIEDISCDGVNIPIFVFHRNPSLGSLITNIVFKDADELDSFITRLAQISGKAISIAEPLVDATLPDGSRLQATLATDIARKGSNFTIRKFTEKPLTPTDLLNFNTIDARSLAFLWLAVDYGRSIIVSGGTASGKTTLLNVLSLFIRPEKKIISIEDTAELQLPHEHWVPTVARTPVSETKLTSRLGEVDMFTLLKESFRQRPDYIIVGEVRGREAFILFQQMATGHPSLATIHAENLPKLMDRLTTPPISLHPSLIINADLVIFIARMRYKEKHVRRVTEILELVGYDREKNMPIVNTVFKWNPVTDRLDSVGKSITLKKISDLTGIPVEELVEELKRRAIILNWMQERNIKNYEDVFKVFNEYYSSPVRLVTRILGEM
jgi:flagellar protein FlaI